MRHSVSIGFVLFALWAGVAAADDLSEAIERDYSERLGALFEHFHRNPELSYLETNTAARLATELRESGVEVTEGVGGTGLVGLRRRCQSSPGGARSHRRTPTRSIALRHVPAGLGEPRPSQA